MGITAERLKIMTKKSLEEEVKNNSKIDTNNEWIAFGKNNRTPSFGNKELYGLRVVVRNFKSKKTGKVTSRLFIELYQEVIDKIGFSKAHHNLKPFFSKNNDKLLKICKCKKTEGFSPSLGAGGIFRFGVLIKGDAYEFFNKLTTYVSYEIKCGDIIAYLDKPLSMS